MAAGFYDIFRWVWGWKSAKAGRGPFCIKAIEFRTGEVVGELRTGRSDNVEARTGTTEPVQAGCP